jgi:choline-glycine betaine transporter
MNACKVADFLIPVNVEMPANFGLPRLSTANLVCSFLFTEFVYIVHPSEFFCELVGLLGI